jgi:fructokinase
LTHPEMGHVRIPHDDGLDPFAGTCPFHGDCFEGLASGEAIRQRWEIPAEQLPSDHPSWVLEADYIAAALNNYIMTLSPQRIILGGGVMQQKHLFPRIRTALKQYLAGYIADTYLNDKINQFVVSPRMGQKAGLVGACALAGTCLQR